MLHIRPAHARFAETNDLWNLILFFKILTMLLDHRLDFHTKKNNFAKVSKNLATDLDTDLKK